MQLAVLRFGFLSIAALVLVSLVSAAQAQQPERRPLLESLLRGVLEQQLNRARPDSRVPTPPPRSAADMNRAGEAFQSVEREVDRLVSALSGVARQSAAASRLHDQAVLLRATATRAVVLAQSRKDDQGLGLLAQKMDRDWRDLEFRLKETFEANASLQRYIDSITREVRGVSQLFSVKEQFSVDEAVRELEAFSDSVGHLAEGVEVELRFSNQRAAYILDARRVEQLAKYMEIELQEGADLPKVTRDFESLDKQWRALAVSLRKLDDRHIDRDIRRAEGYINEVRRILRIPQTLNRTELAQLTTALRGDTNKLFDRLTLNRLIELRAPETLITAASEFYGLGEHFELILSDELRRDGLVDSFRSLKKSWDVLRQRLDGMRDRDTMHAIDDVENTMNSLRLMLGAPQVDRRYDSQVATSALAVLGRQLEVDVATRLRSSTYPPTYRRQLEQELGRFTVDAAKLNESVVRGLAPAQLNRDARLLAERWTRLQMMLAKLEPRDRPGVAMVSSRISEQLLKMEIR